MSKDILSPWFITSTLFLFLTFILYLNTDRWGITFYPYTALLVTISIFSMGIGELVARYFIQYYDSKYGFFKISKRSQYIILSRYFLIFVFILGWIVCYLHYSYIISLPLSNDISLLANARTYARYNANTFQSRIIAVLGYMVRGMSYTLVYVFINNSFANNKRFKHHALLYIFAISPILGIEILSTGRTGFIQLFVISSFLYFIAWNLYYSPKTYPLLKAVFIASALLMLFYILFLLLGLLTGKTQRASAWDTISIYTASGLAALNNWLPDAATGLDDINSHETIMSVYGWLYKIGLSDIKDQYIQSFIYFRNGFTTNIYTAFMHYYKDLGFIWCVFIYFLQGAFFGGMYWRLKSIKHYGFGVLLYSYLAYDLFRQITAASFISVYFSITFLLPLFFIIMFYYLVRCLNSDKV